MLPKKIAFVDVETTGLSVTRDRIIEIGIIRVEDGKVTEEFESLINPEVYISPFIENITGISKIDLETAPPFASIQEKVFKMLSDCVFVAHNVRFDFGFLKNEFKRREKSFSSKQFCTVKLSRKLFPQFAHHDLDAIIERFSIACERRHRAFDDAKVLWEFYQKLQTQVLPEELDSAVALGMQKPSLPPWVPKQQVDKLPAQPGVYIFYGENEVPLYVGKSKNIKSRVLSHFVNDYMSSKELTMCQQVKRIDTQVTSGELGAFITESHLIKTLQPMYNRVLRVRRKLVVLFYEENKDGYQTVKMEVVDSLNAESITNVLGIFKSQKQAKDFLISLVEKYSLCEKLVGLEKTREACFGYRLGKCNGACVKQEIAIKYNMRAIEAFSLYKIKSWPFKSAIVVKEKNEELGMEEQFVFDKWCLVENKKFDSYGAENAQYKDATFDLDVYRIFLRYLQDKNNRKNITTPCTS